MARYEIDNQPFPIDFQCGNELVARTLQNAKNLLMICKGEVPYDRYRGFDPALYDLPMQAFQEALLPEMDRVMLWEPDAEVVDATCERGPNGEMIIRATLEIGGA